MEFLGFMKISNASEILSRLPQLETEILGPCYYFVIKMLHVRPTGATLGNGLIAPADPTATDGRRKSINPLRVLNDELSTRAVILANFPTLPQLS